MKLDEALLAFILLIALIYSTKHVHALVSFLGGKLGGGSVLGNIGGTVAGKAVSSGMSAVRSTAKKAGGFVLDKGNQFGGWGLDKVRDKLDDAGWLDKGDGKSKGIGSALGNMAKDAFDHHGGSVADASRELAHRVMSHVPGVNKEKHEELANMYSDKRSTRQGIRQGMERVGEVEKAKTQYDNDSVAHNLAQHRLDSLLSHSPEAKQLKDAQADMDQFKATDPLAKEKKAKMEFAKRALQEAKREYLKQQQSGGVSPQDKKRLSELQNNYNLAEIDYNQHIESSPQAKKLRHAQQKYDAFVQTNPEVKQARDMVERTGFRVAQSKDAYMENKLKFDQLSLQQKMLPQTYDIQKELIKSLSKTSKKGAS